MKKILIIIIFFITLPSLINAQLSGSGTLASPFSGTFEGDLQWNSTSFSNGKVFIDGDITIDDEELIIEAGMNIIFIAEGSDLIITGTGQLTADATSDSPITFTADDDDDSNYGETGERWGHISFESMTTTNPENYPSVIDNCIIEFGQKSSSPSNIEAYGGGLQINFTYLTVSHSIIRNNYAGFGGGIFINKDVSPTISNCQIENNSSASSGGGVYVWSRSSSLISNCLIFSNTSTTGGGGGGFFLGNACNNVRIINCTIANNNSGTWGKNIHLYYNNNTNRPTFVNCIVWNPENSIYYTGQTPASTDFVNCAIQGYTTGYTSCINLSDINGDPTGPNFNATDGSDWSIKFISPCRDIGTSIGAPLTDILGNNRIGDYDIGAYEVQYSRWSGATSTNWETVTNWSQNLVPSTSSGVVIPDVTNDPTISIADIIVDNLITEPGGNLNVDPDLLLTVNELTNAGTLTLQPNAKGSVSNLINNGILNLKSDASGIASLIPGTYIDNGTENIELYLPGKELLSVNNWHYISSPVSSLTVSTFAPSPTQNLAQYVESLPSGDNGGPLEGWIAYDGFNYVLGLIPDPALHTFNFLTVGQGYNYFHTVNYKYTFSGTLNTSDVAIGLEYNGIPTLNGFNLLGNPFSSGLDWDDIVNDLSYPANTSKGLYFTSNNVQYSYIGGVGIPGDVTGIIPPMQGFFVKTYSTGNTITLAAGARTNDNIHDRYKGETIIPLVRLSVAEGSVSDETVVRFDNLAKSTLDYDFDLTKMFFPESGPSIYSTLDGIKYSINGLPFPETVVEIPIDVSFTTSGEHTISTTQLQGLNDYFVSLTDNITGFVADLKTNPDLVFSAPAGSVIDRFILKVSDLTTGTEDPLISKNIFNIYHANNMITIQPMSDDWSGKTGSINILDITGKVIGNKDNSEFLRNSVIEVSAPVVKGIYIVEIKSGIMRYVGKVVIR